MATPKKRKQTDDLSTEDKLARLNEKLPFSDEAERGVLSCLLQDPEDRVPETRSKIPADAFYHEANRIVYEAILQLDGAEPRVPPDPVTLTHHLRDTKKLDKVGGAAAISDLFSFTPVSAHYPFYLRIVRDKWIAREGIEAHSAGILALQQHGREEEDTDVMDVLQEGDRRVFEVIEAAQHGQTSGPVHVGTAVNEVIEHVCKLQENKGKLLGISTGWPDLDRAMGGIGLEAGDVFCVAARPKMGKTNVLCSLLKAISVDQNVPTAVFSLEMSRARLMRRVLFGAFNIETSKASTGFLDRRDDQENLQRATRILSASPIYIDDSTDLSTADLRARVRILKRKHGIRVVMLDYVQLVTAVTKIGLSEERHQIAEVMKTLHSIARSEQLIIVALAQAGRGAESNPRHEPTAKDFDGGSAIEKFVDYGSFIHRPSKYKRWEDLKEAEQTYFMNTIREQRRANPAAWAPERPVLTDAGREVLNEDGTVKTEWCPEDDWKEHALLLLPLNRNGDEGRIWLRFEKDFTRFSARNTKLYSNNEAHRQIEMNDRFVAPPSPKKGKGKAKDDDAGWDDFSDGDDLPFD